MDSSVHPRQSRTASIVVMLLLAAYAAIRQFHTDDVVLAVSLSVVIYFLAVAAFYGVARLAYGGMFYGVMLIALGAALTESIVSGFDDVWLAFSTWGMIAAAGLIVGRQSRREVKPGRVVTLGLIVTIVFCVVQYAPYWSQLMQIAAEQMTQQIDTVQQTLIAAGDSPELVDDKITTARRLFDVIIRLIPAGTILSTLTQFGVAYLIFVRWASRNGMSLAGFRPFFEWKMPFAIMPAVMVVILMRLIGSDGLVIVADNALAMASIFYCLTGLALMEYAMRKLRLSRLMKVMFYLFLFISQFVGFFVAALLGFIDSFADWRKVRTVNAG